jgi:NAD(P)-dependent dehydrogenase (short-subunit alcohol dehydrogenase family)
MSGMEGWSVVITGGASGIGQATAILLAAEGCRVTIGDLQPAAGEATVSRIRSSGGEAQFLVTNVTEDESVAALVAAAALTFGPLRGAVNAAGVPMCGKRFHELTLADLDRNLDVNLRGTFLSMRHEIRAMLDHGSGSVVNIASTAAVVGLPRGADYCASKAGVMGLTRAAAADYATSGIRVNAILPGGTLTPMLQAAIDQDDKVAGMLAAVHPMNRLAEPREIATAIRWLVSDDSSFATGLGIPIDGGQGSVLIAPGDR